MNVSVVFGVGIKNERMKKIILTLGVAGTLFAGYLSGVRFFGQTCAFNESCPYFLGYPACYFGFVMFTVITLIAAWLVFGKPNERISLAALLAVSFLGILFAGYYTGEELPLLLEQGFSTYVLGLPTCALGLVFYILIFAFSLREYLAIKKSTYSY